MKNATKRRAEEAAYADLALFVSWALASSARFREVLEGRRAVVDVKGDLGDGVARKGRKPPYNANDIDFIDDALKDIISFAVAARVALGRAREYAVKPGRDG